MIEAALRQAGCVGVEMGADGVIYARVDAALPEFTVQPDGARWRFAQQWPVRATPAQRASWDHFHPDAPMDVDLGETRIQFWGGAQDAPHWADLARAMVAQCIRWRRSTRQGDEGM
jgi:hypothetical protein